MATACPAAMISNFSSGGLDERAVRRGRTTIRFRWGSPTAATLAAGSVRYFRDGRRRFHALRIPHEGRFELQIILA